MNRRNWVLVGVFVALGVAYVVWFTDWLRPAPIEIVSQVRFSVTTPHFGRPAKKPQIMVKGTNLTEKVVIVRPPGEEPRVVESGPTPPGGGPGETAKVFRVARQAAPPVNKPGIGKIEQAPGGVANVTFTLDAWYKLTRVRVEDVPADGSKPHVLWDLVGKSEPVDWLVYGINPEGMKPLLEGSKSEYLKAGVPYRLIIEAGRHRGTNDFKTIELETGQ